MNKYLKGFLIFLAIVLLIAAILAGCFWWSMENSKKRAVTDGVKYSQICDTARWVIQKPTITLGKFDSSEIDRLKFYIIRNNKVVKDTTVQYQMKSSDHYLQAQIPFDTFLKTDTIIVATKGSSRRFYRISGFHYYAYLHYGMFGYTGGYHCSFADNDYIVNGKRGNGILLKEQGVEGAFLPQ